MLEALPFLRDGYIQVGKGGKGRAAWGRSCVCSCHVGAWRWRRLSHGVHGGGAAGLLRSWWARACACVHAHVSHTCTFLRACCPWYPCNTPIQWARCPGHPCNTQADKLRWMNKKRRGCLHTHTCSLHKAPRSWCCRAPPTSSRPLGLQPLHPHARVGQVAAALPHAWTLCLRMVGTTAGVMKTKTAGAVAAVPLRTEMKKRAKGSHLQQQKQQEQQEQLQLQQQHAVLNPVHPVKAAAA